MNRTVTENEVAHAGMPGAEADRRGRVLRPHQGLSLPRPSAVYVPARRTLGGGVIEAAVISIVAVVRQTQLPHAHVLLADQEGVAEAVGYRRESRARTESEDRCRIRVVITDVRVED